MEALRAYNSDSDSDTEPTIEVTCELKGLARDTTCEPQASDSKKLPDNDVERSEISMKRKLSTGYITKRKFARLDDTVQQEVTSVLSTSSRDISLYLSSHATKQKGHARSHCMVPKSIPYVTFTQHTKPVLGLHWHPSDERLLLSCSLDGTVRLWDVLWQKECVATYTMQEVPIKKVLWTTNITMVSAGYDNCTFHTDVESGRVLSKLKHNGHVTALAIHPEDTNSLLTGTSKSELHRWDLRCSKEVNKYKGAGGSILDILFLKGGDQFVASSDIERRSGYSQALNIWDYDSGVVLASQLYFEPYSCPFLRLHPVESVFLAQSNASYLTIFSSKKPYKMNKFKRFEGHSLDGYSVGFDVSNDGSIICSASATGTTIFYDYFSTNVLKCIPLATSSTLSVEWHPKLPSTVAVSSWDGHIFCLK